jgi:hypothetical protein
MQLMTPYHLQANSAVERFHCQLKDSLWVQRASSDWISSALGTAGVESSSQRELWHFSGRTGVWVAPLSARAVPHHS